jgi:hypothetical protein
MSALCQKPTSAVQQICTLFDHLAGAGEQRRQAALLNMAQQHENEDDNQNDADRAGRAVYEGDLLRAPREQLWSAPEVPGALLQTLLAKSLQAADFSGCLLLRLELHCASQQTCSSNNEMGQ